MKILKEIFVNTFGVGNAFFLKYGLRPKIIPDSIRIDICADCNAKCPFCPRVYMPEDRMKGFMDLAVYKQVVTEASDLGIKKIKLYITSEPSLHPDFEQIVDIANGLGMKIFVSTNASTVGSRAEIFKKIDVIQFSVEGWDKESYEKYRTPLKFDRVYKSIEKYFASSPPSSQFTSIHVPLTKHTELERFLSLWGNFVDEIRIDFMQPANLYYQGVMESGKNELLDGDYFEFEQVQQGFKCFDPFEELTVGYDGKIMLCCLDFSASYELGHISDGLLAVHNNAAIKNVRKQFYKQKLDVCKGCSLFYKPSEDAIGKVREGIAKFEISHKIKAKIRFDF